MPVLTSQLGPGGAIIGLGVNITRARFNALSAANCPIPAPQIIRGLIDTGASCTAIDPTVVQALSLVPTGQVPIHTPSTGATPHQCNQYDVSLAILLGGTTPVLCFISDAIPVIESALSHQGIQALIGRDVLAKGVLWYNGHAGTLSIAF